MDTQANDNTQITDSGRKIKYGLYFVNSYVPEDRLDKFEVAFVENERNLRIKQISPVDLYQKVFDIMRQSEFKLRNNKAEECYLQRIQDYSYINCGKESVIQCLEEEKKMEDLKSKESILDHPKYKIFDVRKHNNFQECLDKVFEDGNYYGQLELVNKLHNTNKLSKILETIPIIPYKEVLKQYNKEVKEAKMKFQKQEIKKKYQQKEQIVIQEQHVTDQQQMASYFKDNKTHLRYSSAHIPSNTIYSFEQLSPIKELKESQLSSNNISSVQISQIKLTNYATESKFGAKKSNGQYNRKNFETNINNEKIFFERSTMSTEKNLFSENNTVNNQKYSKINFAGQEEILEYGERKKLKKNNFLDGKDNVSQKLENKYDMFISHEKDSHLVVSDLSMLRNQRYAPQQNHSDFRYSKFNQLGDQRELNVPKSNGKQQVQKYSDWQIDCNRVDEHSEQKYINQDCSQQITSHTKRNSDFNIFQQKLADNVANQNLIKRPTNFFQPESKNLTTDNPHFQKNLEEKSEQYIKIPNNKPFNQPNQISKHQLKATQQNIIGHRKSSTSYNEQISDQNKISSSYLESIKEKLFPKYETHKNQNDSIFLSGQKNKFESIQRNNPFKSLQKQLLTNNHESSPEKKSSSQLSALTTDSSKSQSRNRIGAKIQMQGNKIVSHVIREQSVYKIDDDIQEIKHR